MMRFMYSIIPTLIMLLVLGAGFLALGAQVYLAKKKSPLPGLVLIVVTAMLFSGLTVWTHSLPTGRTEQVISCELSKGRTAEARVRYDEHGKAAEVSNISIKDKDGMKLDEVAWGEYRLKDVQQRLALPNTEMEKLDWISENETENSVKVGNTTFSRNIFIWMMFFIDLPLLVIYLLIRRQIRKKRRQDELRKMSIQEL